MSSLVSTFHDTAVSPETWPHAPTVVTDAAGVALIILNKSTGNVDEPCFSGLSAGRKFDYVRHYAAGDPYSPLLDRSWKKLSDCLPDSVLWRCEWYDDFALTCDVRDILGTRLLDTLTHCIFGIHRRIGRSFSDSVDSIIDVVPVPLRQAAPRHVERLSSSRTRIFNESQTRILAKGSRFYFQLDSRIRYPDETGSVFSTPRGTAHALILAQELAQGETLARVLHFLFSAKQTYVFCVSRVHSSGSSCHDDPTCQFGLRHQYYEIAHGRGNTFAWPGNMGHGRRRAASKG
jgi:hypothetical protein